MGGKDTERDTEEVVEQRILHTGEDAKTAQGVYAYQVHLCWRSREQSFTMRREERGYIDVTAKRLAAECTKGLTNLSFSTSSKPDVPHLTAITFSSRAQSSW